MGDFVDLTGMRFERLVVESYIGTKRLKSGAIVDLWHCICDCGNEVDRHTSTLRSGNTKSCGCLRVDMLRKAIASQNGMSTSKTYVSWHGMMELCYNQTHKNYKYYGGKGVVVCDRWHDFLSFLEDMGEVPDDFSIDRISNEGNYEPGNCRWASRIDQGGNKSNNRILTVNGESHILAEWGRILGIMPETITARLRRGWSIEEALAPTKWVHKKGL